MCAPYDQTIRESLGVSKSSNGNINFPRAKIYVLLLQLLLKRYEYHRRRRACGGGRFRTGGILLAQPEKKAMMNPPASTNDDSVRDSRRREDSGRADSSENGLEDRDDARKQVHGGGSIRWWQASDAEMHLSPGRSIAARQPIRADVK